ncbi:MAG TPA: SDR family oxidoreductase [Candidatus Eremiobacteraceae bacterium]|jgi:NAD(P)-dependent dehydrogenase (short-subunit alcohol dehydrogenase family)|nr:SDR family oxidoreductase [Candidatus Eremiobacteraceae bacterium]
MQRAVVVTGASSGIGAATAELLAREGFLTYAGVRSPEDGAKAAALHENIRPLHLDVTDRDSIGAAAEVVAKSGAALHGLVSNAGIAVGGPLEFLPVDELRRQFEVNVFGGIAVSQAFLPQLRESRGRIVFVGSVSGRIAVPYLGPYAASKFALRALSDALRAELAPAGVFVALVEPGSVKTPIWQKGVASRAQLEQTLGPQAIAHYRDAIDRLFRQTQSAEQGAMPVERVTVAILHALTARRPHTNYLVGAKMASLIATLPARVRDRLAFSVRHLH